MKSWQLILIAFAVILLGLVLLAFLPGASNVAPLVQNGTSSAIELGSAGDYGYATFFYSGTGNVSLIALSERPKSQIIVLKQDYLSTERYPYFVAELKKLEQLGFSVSEVDSIGSPNNTIIVIPSGAMPSDILERLDNLTADNKVIFIGEKNLIYTSNLVHSDWFSNLSEYSKKRILVIEKNLDQFYTEKNYTIFQDIERNSWAMTNSETFNYSGQGKKTAFLELRNGTWLRLLPLSDSAEFLPSPANITGNAAIFPWEKTQLTVQLNYTNGLATYSLEKDGAVLASSELDRVREDEAFYIPLSFTQPGDYLFKVEDDSGTIGARRIHVKDLNISLAHSYGNLYEFSVLLDGQPLAGADATVGLNHSTNTVNSSVLNGKLSVNANLRQGENVFIITIFNHPNYISYNNSQEGILQFYVKYLIIGAVIIAAFYFLLRMNQKPVYRILVPESVAGANSEIRLSSKEVLSAMGEAERRFGWKSMPLYAKEIGAGLKKLTGGMDVTEGNVEAVMKKLGEKGLVRSHLGLYGLAQWGNARQNALRRIVRDKLVQNGLSFTENTHSFECRDWQIIFDPAKATREAIVVFEDRDEKRSYVSSLSEKQRASLELKVSNGVLRLATLDALDELL